MLTMQKWLPYCSDASIRQRSSVGFLRPMARAVSVSGPHGHSVPFPSSHGGCAISGCDSAMSAIWTVLS